MLRCSPPGIDRYATDQLLRFRSHPQNPTGWPSGRVADSPWGFGDGTVFSNRPYASHAWAETGDYPVVLSAYNETHPEGIHATVTVRVVAQPVHYVSAASTNPIAPYTNWESAAPTIQAAVQALPPAVWQGSLPDARDDLLAHFEREFVSRLLRKTLHSAVANAENNHNLNSDDLIIKEAIVEEGPAFRRFKPAARGSAKPIRKRTSHLRIILTESTN